jgi:hypothetical protein
MKSTRNARRVALGLLSALAVLAGCQDDHGPVAAPSVRQPVAAGLEVSTLTAGAGDRVVVAVRTESPEPLQALQGYVRFNPSRLEYVGQPAGKSMVLVNDRAASRGELRLISVEPMGLDARAATLIFQVRGGDYTNGLQFAFEGAVTRHADFKMASPRVLTAAPDLGVAEAARYTVDDWMQRLAPELYSAAKRAPKATAGQYAPNLKYGDANLDGNINVLDVGYLSNIAVGLTVLFDGTSRDAVIAGNVRPVNGGTAGSPRPGVEPGTATPDGNINVLDVGAVSNFAVGFTAAVVGDVIPGRGPTSTPWTDTVVIVADITTNTHFTKNHLYQIGDATDANVYVRNNATLTIDPGTRIEGWYGTGVFGSGGVGQGQGTLIIQRDGRIVADGTALEPIIFSCRLPNFMGPRGEAIGTRWPGCWGGLIIAGNATINSDAATSSSNPANGTRSTAGCIQDQDESDPLTLYGGCNDADSSGVLRYVRAEYGGARFTETKERNGITFNGVGNHTLVDYVQSHASLDDGTEYFGGTVNIKHLLLTANEDDNFDYNYGYRGSVQYVIVQADSIDGDRCFEMDNNGIDAGNPDATPRANPTIFNVTCVGKQQPFRYTAVTGLPTTCHTQVGATPTSISANCVNQALLFRQNTSGTMRNVLVYRYASALDFDQPSGSAGGGVTLSPTGICDAVGAGILRNAAISVGPIAALPPGTSGGVSVAADQDGTDPGVASGVAGTCGGYTAPPFDGSNLEALYEANATNNITVFAAGDVNGDYLVNPLDRQVPDFRPKPGSAPTTLPVAASPGTVNGYTFETTTYLGAVSPTGIPWYVGWTRGMTDATHP